MKVLIDVNIQDIDRIILCDNKVLQQQHFFIFQKRQFERRIISKREHIHCSEKSPCPNTRPKHAGFFGYLDEKVLEHIKTKFRTYENMIVWNVVSD